MAFAKLCLHPDPQLRPHMRRLVQVPLGKKKVYSKFLFKASVSYTVSQATKAAAAAAAAALAAAAAAAAVPEA
jgi:hypothetical protein